MIDWEEWSGEVLRERVLQKRRFPEFDMMIGGDGVPIPHDNPWHLESIFDHTCAVIDAGRMLSQRYHLSSKDHAILMASCTWHDVGKMAVRAPKERFICLSCGRPRVSESDGCPCGGEMERRTVMGYHGHANISSGDWMFGNISTREDLPADLSSPVRTVIYDHLWGNIILSKDEIPAWVSIIYILMFWADEIGRTRSPFDVFDYDSAFSELMETRR